MKRLLLLLLVAASSSSCVIAMQAIERELPVCDGYDYDNLRGRHYVIFHVKNGQTTEGGITLTISKQCEVTWPEDISDLDVESMGVSRPRSSKHAALLIYTKVLDSSGDKVTCRATLEPDDPMRADCEWDQGELFYEMHPTD
jgi:hypothetical protein